MTYKAPNQCEAKPQSAETMATGIANDLLGAKAPEGALQMLRARLTSWREAIIEKTLADVASEQWFTTPAVPFRGRKRRRDDARLSV